MVGAGSYELPAPAETPVEEVPDVAQISCNVDGCKGSLVARGLCAVHYGRAKRRGELPARMCPCGAQPASPDGRGRPKCRSCQVATKSAAERRRQWRHRYGIDDVEYNRRLTAQDGRCCICGSTDSRRGSAFFDVDHDHETDQVRGLLCGPCNRGIGLLGDDPARLRAAADYIESHRNT